MPRPRLIYCGACLALLLSATFWASGCGAPGSDGPGTGGSGATAGTSGSAGAGATGSAGNNATAGTTGQGGNTSTAGTTGSGGSSAGTGGSTATGTAGTTGTAGRGGTTGTAGNAGTTGTAGRGGTTGTAGASAGTSGTAGTTGAAGTGVRMDQAGVPLGKVGDTTNMSKKYINLGDMRLINNRWGSDAKNCGGTVQSVSVNSDRTIGWKFQRGACDSSHGSPDFPEVEFGIAPFGTNSSLLTTPNFSSTTLLPIQIKNLTSASVNVDTFQIGGLSGSAYWDNNVEFWISKNDPRTSDGAVYAEIIAFTGFQGNRLQQTVGWPCDKTGNVTAGSTNWNLCHQSDTWSSGWRFFNFNVANGPFSTWTGKLDIKAMLTWVMNAYSGFSGDYWLTRIEVGTEVDDNTSGEAKIKGLTFEINGTSKSIELQP